MVGSNERILYNLKNTTVILQRDVENVSCFVPEIEGRHVLEEQIIW